jgi:transposase
VITDIIGKTGRAIIQALISGESNPVKLAVLADPRIKASLQQLREAVHAQKSVGAHTIDRW